jgi:hypothetical protein
MIMVTTGYVLANTSGKSERGRSTVETKTLECSCCAREIDKGSEMTKWCCGRWFCFKCWNKHLDQQ